MSKTVVGYVKIIPKDKENAFIPYYIVYDDATMSVLSMYADDIIVSELQDLQYYKLKFKRLLCPYGGAYAIPVLLFNEKSIDEYKSYFEPTNCYEMEIDFTTSSPEGIHNTNISGMKADTILEMLSNKSQFILKNYDNAEIKVGPNRLSIKDIVLLDDQSKAMIKYYESSDVVPYKTYDKYLENKAKAQQAPQIAQTQTVAEGKYKEEPTKTQQPQINQYHSFSEDTQASAKKPIPVSADVVRNIQKVQAEERKGGIKEQPETRKNTQEEMTNVAIRNNVIETNAIEQNRDTNLITSHNQTSTGNIISGSNLNDLTVEDKSTLRESYNQEVALPNIDLKSITLSNISKRNFTSNVVRIPNLQLKEVL